MISSKKRTQQKKDNNIIKYSNYILLISTLSVVYGSASHQTEFLTIGLLFFAGLIFTQKEDIKRLEFDNLSKQLDIDNLEEKISDFEDIIKVFQDNNDSIIDEYEPRQIEEAKESLVKSGLCDTIDQAQRNLEMDLEERYQLATGGGKKRRNK